MKILIIDEWLPWPLESGKKIRSYNLAARLANKHEITYMAYASLPGEENKVKALQDHGINVVEIKDARTSKWSARFYGEVLLNLLSREPFSSWYHIRRPYIAKLRQYIAAEKPDLVHCEWTNLAPFLAYCGAVPKVIAAHNIESDIWKRWARNEGNLFKRLIARNQAAKIERLEREWYPKVDHCIAVTQLDQQVIQSYGAKASVVENGVDVEYYDNYARESGDENVLAFTASFDTFANQDGARYLVKDIMPLVRRQRPGIRLLLVGKQPSREILAYAKVDTSILVTGTVPDVREYIRKAGVCVVPLRVGGGSRLKILEAMAMRKPVVSTTVGAEGLRVVNGKEILLADRLEDFAGCVAECIRDRKKRESLGEAGYALVRKTYDWGELAEKQDAIWNEVVAT